MSLIADVDHKDLSIASSKHYSSIKSLTHADFDVCAFAYEVGNVSFMSWLPTSVRLVNSGMKADSSFCQVQDLIVYSANIPVYV